MVCGIEVIVPRDVFIAAYRDSIFLEDLVASLLFGLDFSTIDSAEAVYSAL